MLQILAVIFIGGSFYLFWAVDRSEPWLIGHDASWPHGFPYPDKALAALEHYLDQARPVSRGVKMRGEFPLVQKIVRAAWCVCAGAGFLCALPTLIRLLRRASPKTRGFPMTPMGSISDSTK